MMPTALSKRPAKEGMLVLILHTATRNGKGRLPLLFGSSMQQSSKEPRRCVEISMHKKNKPPRCFINIIRDSTLLSHLTTTCKLQDSGSWQGGKGSPGLCQVRWVLRHVFRQSSIKFLQETSLLPLRLCSVSTTTALPRATSLLLSLTAAAAPPSSFLSKLSNRALLGCRSWPAS